MSMCNAIAFVQMAKSLIFNFLLLLVLQDAIPSNIDLLFLQTMHLIAGFIHTHTLNYASRGALWCSATTKMMAAALLNGSRCSSGFRCQNFAKEPTTSLPKTRPFPMLLKGE